MSRYGAIGALAGLAVLAAMSATPEDRETRIERERAREIRRCFKKMLVGIAKAHDCGFPNISRQQRRQFARKGVAALSADTGSREG